MYLQNLDICNFFGAPLLTWVMIKSIIPSVTIPVVIYELQLLSVVQTIVCVHHSQAISISYTFLVADYWSSTAMLRYKSLCTVWWSAHLATGLLHCSKCRASTEQKKKGWGIWVQLATTLMIMITYTHNYWLTYPCFHVTHEIEPWKHSPQCSDGALLPRPRYCTDCMYTCDIDTLTTQLSQC